MTTSYTTYTKLHYCKEPLRQGSCIILREATIIYLFYVVAIYMTRWGVERSNVGLNAMMKVKFCSPCSNEGRWKGVNVCCIFCTVTVKSFGLGSPTALVNTTMECKVIRNLVSIAYLQVPNEWVKIRSEKSMHTKVGTVPTFIIYNNAENNKRQGKSGTATFRAK